MSSPIFWHEFYSDCARGRVGIQRAAYGVTIYLGDEDHAIALVDLYSASPNGVENGKPCVNLIVLDPRVDDDFLIGVKYREDGSVAVRDKNGFEEEVTLDEG